MGISEFYVDFMHPDLVHTISFVKSIGDHETCSPSMQLSESYYTIKTTFDPPEITSFDKGFPHFGGCYIAEIHLPYLESFDGEKMILGTVTTKKQDFASQNPKTHI